jgi:hypothetical protein
MRVILDGRAASNGSPLLMHNERLADPLNEFALEIGKLSRKRGKTETDHLAIARLEFVGGLYYDENDGPVMPVWNIVRCIQNAGKQHKLGASVLRGVIPATETTPVIYEGPRDIEGMWEAGTFALRKSVGIGSSRTMRTRPVFTDWRIEALIEVDLRILDPEKINQLVEEAGRYQGLGDNRPVYGRFLGQAVLVAEEKPAKVEKVQS